jgi:excisionase family DNA binding protein
MNDKLLYTVSEAADALGLGTSKVWELVGAGAIESVRVGRARRIPRDALEHFVDGLREQQDEA